MEWIPTPADPEIARLSPQINRNSIGHPEGSPRQTHQVAAAGLIRRSRSRRRKGVKRQQGYRNESLACPGCPMFLSTRSKLEDHIRARYTGEKSFKCPHCSKEFHSSNARYMHCRRWKAKCQKLKK